MLLEAAAEVAVLVGGDCDLAFELRGVSINELVLEFPFLGDTELSKVVVVAVAVAGEEESESEVSLSLLLLGSMSVKTFPSGSDDDDLSEVNGLEEEEEEEEEAIGSLRDSFKYVETLEGILTLLMDLLCLLL